MTDTKHDFFSDVPDAVAFYPQLRNNSSISASGSSPSQPPSQAPVLPSLPRSQETKDREAAAQVNYQERLREIRSWERRSTALLFTLQPYEATLFPEHGKYRWKDLETEGAGTGACGLDAVCITLGLPRDDPATAAETYYRMRLMILHARIQIGDRSAEKFYSERMNGCLDMDDIGILCMVKFGVIPIIIAPEYPMLFAQPAQYYNIRFTPKNERKYVIIQYKQPGHWICQAAEIDNKLRTLFFEDELPLQLKEEFFLSVARTTPIPPHLRVNP